ncbi:MAG: hypothetical protein JO307_14850 [Bryobacterales bacterium]|nr:hypothetical protein [Bryobacterales bacterium]
MKLAYSVGRVLVSHDVRTMPRWFKQCIGERRCAGLILVPDRLPIRDAIEDLLLIWQLTDGEEWLNRLERLPL